MNWENGAITATVARDRANSVSEDLHAVIAAFQRRAKVFWFGVLVSFTIGVALILQLPPQYTATASVILDQRGHQVVDLQAVMSGFAADIDTEVQIIKSRRILRDVVDNLRLDTYREFNSKLNPPSALRSGINKAQSFINGFLKPAPKAQLSTEQSAANEARAKSELRDNIADRLAGMIQVRRVGLTYVIGISATTKNPVTSKLIANAVAQSYVDDQLKTKYEATKSANTWLFGRLAELRQEVQEAEAKIEAYKTQAGLMSARGSTIVESTVADVSGQINEAKALLAEAQARLDTVRNKLRSLGPDKVAEVVTSSVMQQLRSQYGEALARKAVLETNLGPMHPDMIRVNRELADLNDQILSESRRIVGTMENDVAVARNRLASLESSREAAESNLSVNNKSLVPLRELERNAEAVRSLYESFLTRFKQTSEQETLAESDARIVTEARTPGSPSAPNPKLILAMATAMGLALGAGLVLMFEMFDNAVNLPEELERLSYVPSVGLVPLLKEPDLNVKGRKIEPKDVVVMKPLSEFTEAFRTLKAELIPADSARRPKVIQMTSALIGEGKTLSTVAFGRILALGGTNVVVVDADLRRRTLSDVMGIKQPHGLLEVLLGEARLRDAVVLDEKTGLWVLPLSETSYSPTDVFSSEMYNNMIEELKTRFDIILIDTAPLLAVADSVVISQQADAVVLIAKWGWTPRPAVMQALSELRKVQANVASILLTHVNMKAIARYTYGQGYYSQLTSYYQR